MSLETSMKIAIVLQAYDKMSKTVNDAVNKSQDKLRSFADKADQLADKAFNTGKQLTAAGLAVGAPLYQAIQTAQEFETKMIDIRKQMKINTPETVAAMTKQVMQLGRELPIATSEIQDMIASGLRMGVAEDKIIGFTREVTKMSVAFDMGAGEVADSMGKIANVFKIPIQNVGDFADAINYLDDNTMAKGPELIGVLQRIGGSARNLDPKQAAALSATLLSLGESEETAGSGISAMLNRFSAATNQSKKFQEAMQELGLSSQDLQNKMANKSTSQAAILDVFDRIGKQKPEQQTEALVKLFGNEHGPKLIKLANNVQEYRRQLGLVQGQEKGSMSKEYQKRLESSAAKWQLFKNKIHELWVKVGTSLLPTFIKVVDWLGKMTEKVGAFIDAHPTLIANVGKAAAVFSALAIVGSYLSFVVGGVAKFFSFASTAIGYAIKAFRVLTTIIRVLFIVIRVFPIVGWIMLIATGALLIIKYWNRIVSFFRGLLANIRAQFGGFWGLIKAGATVWFKWLTMPFTMVFTFFKTVYKSFTQGGKNIIESLCDGIKAAINKPVELVKKMVGKIRNLLPFPPAKDGPLRDIHRIKLVETIAQSIKPASLYNKMKHVAGVAFNAIAKPGGSVQGRGGAPVSLNATINLTGSATKQDGTLIAAEIKKQFAQLLKKHGEQAARVSLA